jgi:hypothetical protein
MVQSSNEATGFANSFGNIFGWLVFQLPLCLCSFFSS